MAAGDDATLVAKAIVQSDEWKAGWAALVDAVNTSAGQIGDHLQRLHSTSEQSLKKVEEHTETAKQAFKGLTESVTLSLSGLSSRIREFGEFAGVAFAFLAGHRLFGEVIQESQEWILAAEHLSHTLGISSEEASAWAVAAKEAGVSIAEVQGAVRGLTMTLSTQEGVIQSLGIATRDDLSGQLRPIPDLLLDVVQRINGMENATQRLTVANMVFRRAYPGMLDDLGTFAGQLEHARNIAHSFGVEVSEEGIVDAHALRQSIADIGVAWSSMVEILADAVRPQLEALIDEVSQLAQEGKLQDWAHEVADAISAAGHAFASFIDTVRPLAGLLADAAKAWAAYKAAMVTVAVWESLTTSVVAFRKAIEGLAVAQGVSNLLTGITEVATLQTAAQALGQVAEGEAAAGFAGDAAAGGLAAAGVAVKTVGEGAAAAAPEVVTFGGGLSSLGLIATNLLTRLAALPAFWILMTYGLGKLAEKLAANDQAVRDGNPALNERTIALDKLSAKQAEAAQHEEHIASLQSQLADMEPRLAKGIERQIQMERDLTTALQGEIAELQKKLGLEAEMSLAPEEAPAAPMSEEPFELPAVKLRRMRGEEEDELIAARHNAEERYRITADWEKQIREILGLTPQEIEESYRRVTQAAAAAEDEGIGIASSQVQGELRIREIGFARQRDLIESQAKAGTISEEARLAALQHIDEEEYEARKAALNRQLSLEGANAATVAGIREKLKDLEAEYQKTADDEIIKSQQRVRDQTMKLANERAAAAKKAADDEIAADQAILDIRKRLNIVSDEEYFAQRRVLLDRSHAAEMDELQARIVAAQGNALKIEEIEQQKNDAIAQYTRDLTKLQGDEFAQMAQRLATVFDDLTGSFQTALDGIIQGTQSATQLMQKAWTDLLTHVAGMGEKLASEWLKDIGIMVLAYSTGNQEMLGESKSLGGLLETMGKQALQSFGLGGLLGTQTKQPATETTTTSGAPGATVKPGQTDMNSSLPVAVATDQSPVPVVMGAGAPGAPGAPLAPGGGAPEQVPPLLAAPEATKGIAPGETGGTEGESVIPPPDFSGALGAWDQYSQQALSFEGLITRGVGQQSQLREVTTIAGLTKELGHWILTDVQKLGHWLATELGMTSASTAGANARVAAKTEEEATTTAETLGANKIKSASDSETAKKSLTDSAVSAAGKAYDAFADIPIVGPILGGIAAGATFAAIMAFGSYITAAGGGEIGEPVMALLHPHEMVLPVGVAQGIRAAARAGVPKMGAPAAGPASGPAVSAFVGGTIPLLMQQHEAGTGEAGNPKELSLAPSIGHAVKRIAGIPGQGAALMDAAKQRGLDDIPGEVVVPLQPGEIVLPAAIAAAVRGMVSGASGGSGPRAAGGVAIGGMDGLGRVKGTDGSILSAERGLERVPGGSPHLAVLHPDEMVLPADTAAAVRTGVATHGPQTTEPAAPSGDGGSGAKGGKGGGGGGGGDGKPVEHKHQHEHKIAGPAVTPANRALAPATGGPGGGVQQVSVVSAPATLSTQSRGGTVTADIQKPVQTTPAGGQAMPVQQQGTHEVTITNVPLRVAFSAITSAVSLATMVAPFGIGVGVGVGFGYMSAFLKGGDVPEDMLAKLHQKEMVLPAEIAEGMRSVIKGGPPGPAGRTTIGMQPGLFSTDRIERVASQSVQALHESMEKTSGDSYHVAIEYKALDVPTGEEVLETHSRHISQLVARELRLRNGLGR